MTALIETVSPNDGKLEDKIVFGGSVLILFGAAALLYLFYPPMDNSFQAIPKPLRATLTSLSNAGEELQALGELEGNYPSVEQLAEYGIAPFSASPLLNAIEFRWAQDSNCYIGETLLEQKSYLLRLELASSDKKQTPQVYWRKLPHGAGSSKTLPEHCQSSIIDWNNTSQTNTAQEDTHGH